MKLKINNFEIEFGNEINCKDKFINQLYQKFLVNFKFVINFLIKSNDGDIKIFEPISKI